MTLSPSATLSAPDTIAAVVSPMSEWPMTASGTTPYERQSAVSQLHAHQDRRTESVRCRRPDRPSSRTARSEPACATKSGSMSSTAAANAGSSAQQRAGHPGP